MHNRDVFSQFHHTHQPYRTSKTLIFNKLLFIFKKQRYIKLFEYKLFIYKISNNHLLTFFTYPSLHSLPNTTQTAPSQPQTERQSRSLSAAEKHFHEPQNGRVCPLGKPYPCSLCC